MNHTFSLSSWMYINDSFLNESIRITSVWTIQKILVEFVLCLLVLLLVPFMQYLKSTWTYFLSHKLGYLGFLYTQIDIIWMCHMHHTCVWVVTWNVMLAMNNFVFINILILMNEWINIFKKSWWCMIHIIIHYKTLFNIFNFPKYRRISVTGSKVPEKLVLFDKKF